MSWIIVAIWPDGRISFLRVGGSEQGPDLSELFWDLDVEGNPHAAKLWYCKSHSDVHIGQPDKDGVFCTYKIGEEERPLDRLYFTEGFNPYKEMGPDDEIAEESQDE